MLYEKKYVQQFSIHVFVWVSLCCLIFFPYVYESRNLPSGLIVRLLIAVFLFYINYFVLIPFLLLKKRSWYFGISCLLLVVVAAIFLDLNFKSKISGNFPRRMHLGPPPGRMHLGFLRQFITLLFVSIPIALSSGLRMYIEWKKNENLRQIIETQKANSELQFLKAQLNPHFLFNSLNAIYSLSVKKSPNTSDAIIDLSELMRYMLYEADRDIVPLYKEIEYIKYYVKLQRLRLSDSENVTLKISGEEKGKNIAPLLFISFIENAFKYGTDYNGKTNVIIHFFINEKSIHFYIENKIGVFRKKKGNSGVGLENIKNRLKLLHPTSHELLINVNEETYTVDLTIKL